MNPKVGNIIWNCVEDNVMGENDYYKAIGLHGSNYNLFKEQEGGCVRKGIDGYPFLKHLIELWLGDLDQQLGKINNVVFEKIQHQEEAGKSRPDIMFWKNKSRKCIGFIL